MASETFAVTYTVVPYTRSDFDDTLRIVSPISTTPVPVTDPHCSVPTDMPFTLELYSDRAVGCTQAPVD